MSFKVQRFWYLHFHKWLQITHDSKLLECPNRLYTSYFSYFLLPTQSDTHTRFCFWGTTIFEKSEHKDKTIVVVPIDTCLSTKVHKSIQDMVGHLDQNPCHTICFAEPRRNAVLHFLFTLFPYKRDKKKVLHKFNWEMRKSRDVLYSQFVTHFV